MQKPDFPIFEIEQRLCSTLAAQKRLVLTAPTGSGKSTQVPQILLDGGLLGKGQVKILQPRRLPTRLLATWIARARQVKLGGEVGYQMRLETVSSAATRICYVTEGVLLRQMLADPRLNGVSALIFDEFHERHLFGDIALALALQIQQSSRPDLLIIVMSATLDTAQIKILENYLHPCTVLSSVGRTYPVTTKYLAQPAENTPIWDLAVRELKRLVGEHPKGDALIFMPGAYEIARTVQAVRDVLRTEFVVFPLHGELPPRDQDAAVAKHDRRKVIVATNVAETSLTIDGVCLVIDSGLARRPRFDPYRGINTLLIEKVSRASADQRAGRAGRTAPGYCLRLWTAHEHSSRPAQELPEVKRLDLAEAILTLKANNDVKAFRWLEAPDARALERAETLLADLGAIDGATGAITPLGRRMLAFPIHPRYARMLLAAQDYSCVRPIALIAALTQGRDLLMRRQGAHAQDGRNELTDGESESDFFVLMRAWRLVLEHWDESVEQWFVRVNRLRGWMPELELPVIGEEDRRLMIEHLCHGAFTYGEISNRPVLPVVKAWLSRRQQAWVEEYAPERIQLSKGRTVKVWYSADSAPTIAARIQDLYGIKDVLWIANRGVRVRVQVLAPSNRPVQITENMGDFWRDAYPKLKPQLQRRYPKHEWR
jgi:ATP-dependent helicase HrpB